MFSVEKFHAALRSQGLSIARDTVHQLLAHLGDCFLVRTVWLESRSERRRMVNPRKAYPVDPGLMRVYQRGEEADIGHALETAVLIELERRGAAVTYVRTRDDHEVDFLARYAGGASELIQVCADPSGEAATERELRALVEAGRGYPKARKRLLTLTQDRLPSSAPRGVAVEPAYGWLLGGTGR